VSHSVTEVFPIEFQEAGIIQKALNDFSISRDPEGPSNGFRFIINQLGPSASAIIYLSNVADSDNKAPASVPILFTAVFISPMVHMDGSKTTLVPDKKVKVFFEQKLVTGTMTTSSETHPLDLDFTTDQHQTWFLNNQGKWKQL
ncbi:hypothetical protein C0991_001322, partial [Blastosporella zonata]